VCEIASKLIRSSYLVREQNEMDGSSCFCLFSRARTFPFFLKSARLFLLSVGVHVRVEDELEAAKDSLWHARWWPCGRIEEAIDADLGTCTRSAN
jgi:hypothetical protein